MYLEVKNDINSEAGTTRVEDLCPSLHGKELSVFVATNRAEDGLEDTGINSPIFVSPNRFGVLKMKEESLGSSIPSEGEEDLFSDHIRKSRDPIKTMEMRLTRSNPR